MLVMAFGGMGANKVQAQQPITIDCLRRMSPTELEAVYRGGYAVSIPPGPVRGTAFPAPGTWRAGIASRGARLIWQGKIIEPGQTTAINRFFGIRVIRGEIYQGSSWIDGQPALILDYQNTSRLYARNRDEIRQIAPGLFLGVMHDRTIMPRCPSLYFALETER